MVQQVLAHVKHDLILVSSTHLLKIPQESSLAAAARTMAYFVESSTLCLVNPFRCRFDRVNLQFISLDHFLPPRRMQWCPSISLAFALPFRPTDSPRFPQLVRLCP